MICSYSGKTVYYTFTQAKQKVKEMVRNTAHIHQEGMVLRPYRCAHCGKYHIGNTAIKRKRGRKNRGDD